MIVVARLPMERDTAIVCAVECQAKCCRHPVGPVMRGTEMVTLKTIAKARGLKAVFRNATDWRSKDRWQLEPVNGACPFLGLSTNLCTVYDNRPGVCRDFPTRPYHGCLLSPGGPDDPKVGA